MSRAARLATLLLLLALCTACAGQAERRRLAHAYTDLGTVFAEQQQWDKAGSAWERALELDPGQSVAAFNLARALTEAGRYAEAMALIGRLLRDDPGNGLLLSSMAYILYRQGDYPQALDLYRRVEELGYSDTASLRNLAALQELNGDYPGALASYRRLLAVAPDAVLEYRYGLALVQGGDYETALPYLEKQLGLEANQEALRFALYEAYLGMEDYGLAIEQLNALQALRPQDGSLRFYQARLQLRFMEDYQAGRQNLAAALALGFGDAAAIDALVAALPREQQAAVRQLLPASD